MDKLIDKKTHDFLKEHFVTELPREVEVRFYSELKGEYAEFGSQFLKELSELSDKIKPVFLDTLEGKKRGFETDPYITIGENLGYKLFFNGTPAGNEANTLIETIKVASQGVNNFTPEETEMLNQIDKPVHLQVFTTTSCPYCPQSAVAAARLAAANPKWITAETVEAQENPELSRQFNVSSVPQQVLNGDMNSITIGVQPMGKLLDQVLEYGSSRFTEIKKQMEEKEQKSLELIDNPDSPVTLTDATIDKALEKYENLVVDCWAEWCAPCRMISPIIDTLAKEYTGKLVFAKVNVDKNPGISSKYAVETIPRLLLFKKGKLTETLIGAKPKAELELELAKIFKY